MGIGGPATRRGVARDAWHVSDHQQRNLVVGIDVSAVPVDPRGAGRYVIELVAALNRRGRTEMHLITRRDDAARWSTVAPAAGIHAVVPDGAGARLVWEQLRGPRFVDRLGIDVHHGPHYTMPEAAHVPKVVTIHDLTFFDHPEWHEKVKVPVFQRAIRVAARHADALVCVSSATARRLRELIDPQCPVHVVEHGIDHQAFVPPEAPGIDVADDALRLAELGICTPYLAFLGTLEPRKDLVTLVEAFDALADDHGDVQLVLAGGAGWGENPLSQALALTRHRARIILTGYVDQAVVPALLRRAAAVVYPAIEEGFGLPALEALACGAPLVTTAGSVMEEVASGAAVVAPPGDAVALARALEELMRHGRDRKRRALGLEVAARHSWDATAAGHEAVYAEVVGGPKRHR